MTERSAEQAPVEARRDDQDTARIPLAERLQRRVAAASEERRTNTQAPRESSRVLPPMPAELTEQRPAPQAVSPSAPAAAAPQASPLSAQPEPAARAVQAVPDRTATVAPVRPATATTRRTPAATRAPRRAPLRLIRIDPWSVMKVSFLLSIAFGIVTVVSVFLVWSVLDAAGV